jgi:hypothetical protein
MIDLGQAASLTVALAKRLSKQFLSFCPEWLCFFTISFSAHHRGDQPGCRVGGDFIGNVAPNLNGPRPSVLTLYILAINSLTYAIYVLLCCPRP